MDFNQFGMQGFHRFFEIGFVHEELHLDLTGVLMNRFHIDALIE
jgi:hypothetical protein